MKFKRRKIKRGRVEIIPMIDTIVILLIFYMSFARVAEMGRESKIELPESVAGEEFKKLPSQVIVNMLSADDLTIGGQRYAMAEIAGILSGMKKDDAALSVILRANKEMTYQDLSELMHKCAQAQIADVTFATLEPQ